MVCRKIRHFGLVIAFFRGSFRGFYGRLGFERFFGSAGWEFITFRRDRLFAGLFWRNDLVDFVDWFFRFWAGVGWRGGVFGVFSKMEPVAVVGFFGEDGPDGEVDGLVLVLV